jgi:ferric enterobactin receptor
MDVMKKVPGVIVLGDKISLAGSSNLTILIDGKTTKYMDVESLLKDIPGDNVEKVEVIHQPGAEFDAAGSGPIINIILKKNKLFGTFGSVNTGFSKGDTWRYFTNANFTQYQGNVNISGSVGYRNSEYSGLMDVDRYSGNDLYDQSSFNIKSWETYRANLNMDWNVGKRHRLGFQSRFINYDSEELITTDLDVLSNDILSSSSITRNNRDGFWRFGSVNPYYSFEIDSLGQKLDVDLNYIEYGSKDKNYLVERETNDNSILAEDRMDQPGTTKITVAKIDYTYPFSKHLKFQIGAKYSFADLDNDYQAEDLDSTGLWVKNDQSNHYLFDEVIYAGYAKLSFNKSKWSGTLGLRYEDSQSNGKSVGVDTVLSRRIEKFFPSGSISREITKDIKGVLAYSYRLDRPRYSSLNPFRYNLDAYTYEEGNPELRAEFTHSMKFSLTYQNQPFFNVEYKMTEDPITMVYGQNDTTGVAFRGDENLDMRNEFNVSLFFPLDFIPKISGYGGIIVNNTTLIV